MSGTDATRYAPQWLALREGPDAAARASGLLGPLRRHLEAAAGGRGADPTPGRSTSVIRDLGCGTGSMGRWLAPRLNGPQHWILHDHDPDLLDLAAARTPERAADGSPVTVTTERGDVARLTANVLSGTSLVTASALLDLLTREELNGLAAACAGAGCPALLSLSVVGRVHLTPADPLDAEIVHAFNAHQRRVDQGHAAPRAGRRRGGVRGLRASWPDGTRTREPVAARFRSSFSALRRVAPDARGRSVRIRKSGPGYLRVRADGGVASGLGRRRS